MKKIPVLLIGLLIFACAMQAQQFKVSYPVSIFSDSFSGHVILYLSKAKQGPPRAQIDQPCYSVVVKDIKPGEEIFFNNSAVFYPVPLTKLERGSYNVQAVWDRNLGGRNIGTSPGNIFSKNVAIEISADTTQVVTLVCDQLVHEPVFVNTNFVKELKAPSKLLSRFHGQPVTVDAAVILPAEYYQEPARKFPVLFNISGYGGDYHHYSKENGDTIPSVPMDTTPCIKVYIDGNCPLGHCVYANSDNNGPWGDAFTREFIPLLEKTYRCNGAFLMKGHSSGGWACLWLQTHYPKLFAGCNASAPDYVDFRNLAKRNIYEDTTRHTPMGTPGHKPHVEDVLYRGEQQVSFNAVYSPKGADGYPMSLYNQLTGYVNPVVLDHWKQYDISLYVRSNWNRLKNDLSGKIRISVGNEDTYKLNFSVEKMEEAMKEIGAGVAFAYYPGDHYTVATKAYRYDQEKWLEDKYQEWLKKQLPEKSKP